MSATTFDFAAHGITVHPACAAFPMMSEQEFHGLCKDVLEHGLREDIVFAKDQLVDGRNRLAACIATGTEWKGHAAELDDDIDPIGYVISHNIHRRNLTTSQLAMIGGKLRDMYDEAARQRQLATLKKGPQLPDVESAPERGRRSRDEAGIAVGVSGKSIDAATAVLKSGDQQLIAKVESGDVTVTAAARQLKADQEKAAKLMDRMATADAEPAAPKSSGKTRWDALLKRYKSAARLFDELVAERRTNELSDRIISHHEAIEALIPQYRKSITNKARAARTEDSAK